MFKEPVEVLPNVNYTACATLKVCLTPPPTQDPGSWLRSQDPSPKPDPDPQPEPKP